MRKMGVLVLFLWVAQRYWVARKYIYIYLEGQVTRGSLRASREEKQKPRGENPASMGSSHHSCGGCERSVCVALRVEARKD